MYEKAGFKRMAEFEGWPEGHVNVVLLQNTMSRNARCRFGVKRYRAFHRQTGPEVRFGPKADLISMLIPGGSCFSPL